MTDEIIDSQSYYNLGALRELLLGAFTAKELQRFCLDRIIFRPVVSRFGPGHGLDDMVDEVIDYCRTRLLWDDLLAEVRQANPRQYTHFESSLLEKPVASPGQAILSEEQARLRAKQEKVLSELLAPMVMQLERTRRAFDRWRKKNLYLEAEIIRTGNLAVRDLLVAKAHLVPPDLVADANQLVTHYDAWLEEYEHVRGGADPDLDTPFVFVGPKGYPFPKQAERRFRERFEKLRSELYG